MDVAKVNDAVVQGWKQFERQLAADDYRALAGMSMNDAMRYAYEVGWADGQAKSKADA